MTMAINGFDIIPIISIVIGFARKMMRMPARIGPKIPLSRIYTYLAEIGREGFTLPCAQSVMLAAETPNAVAANLQVA